MTTRIPARWSQSSVESVLAVFIAVTLLFANGCLLVGPNCFTHLLEDPDDFPDYQSTLEQWRAESDERGCSGASTIEIGTCSGSDIRFLYRFDGFSTVTNYYDADGQFIATRETTDFPIPPCFGVRYWPGRINCEDRVVTETICGSESDSQTSQPVPE